MEKRTVNNGCRWEGAIGEREKRSRRGDMGDSPADIGQKVGLCIVTSGETKQIIGRRRRTAGLIRQILAAATITPLPIGGVGRGRLGASSQDERPALGRTTS